MLPIKIYAGDRVVGVVIGTVFYRRARASKHFLRVPRAIAFGIDSRDQAERAGARSVEVLDVESGRIFRSEIATIRAKGFRISRGFGEQIALALNRWNRDAGVEQLPLAI